jgi:hypothetical protein
VSLRLLLAALVCIAGGAAHAGTLQRATWSQTIQGVEVTLTMDDTDFDGVPDVGSGRCVPTDFRTLQNSILCPANGLLGSTGHTIAATSYSVSLVMPLFSLNQFTTGGAINIHTRATLEGPALIHGGYAGGVGDEGFGMVTIRVASHVRKGVNASMQTGAKTTLLKLPLSSGVSARQTGYFTILGIGHHVTMDFYGWTHRTRTFTGLTSKFAPLPTPTVSAMGALVLRPGNDNHFASLIAPSRISIDGPLAQRRTASFTTLHMLFHIPEPAVLLLLAAGAGGLALLGGRRRASDRG